jgi:hypothetical protein
MQNRRQEMNKFRKSNTEPTTFLSFATFTTLRLASGRRSVDGSCKSISKLSPLNL